MFFSPEEALGNWSCQSAEGESIEEVWWLEVWGERASPWAICPLEKVGSVLKLKGQLEECVLCIGLGRWKVASGVDWQC